MTLGSVTAAVTLRPRRKLRSGPGGALREALAEPRQAARRNRGVALNEVSLALPRLLSEPCHEVLGVRFIPGRKLEKGGWVSCC